MGIEVKRKKYSFAAFSCLEFLCRKWYWLFHPISRFTKYALKFDSYFTLISVNKKL